MKLIRTVACAALLVKEAGCGLVCSEMVSADGLVHGAPNAFDLLRSLPAAAIAGRPADCIPASRCRSAGWSSVRMVPATNCRYWLASWQVNCL